MESTPRHFVSVAALSLDEAEDQVLLTQRRDNGNWEPPGGVLELDKTLEEGLRREVLEETGAQLVVGGSTGVYKKRNAGDRGLGIPVHRADTNRSRDGRGLRHPVDLTTRP